MTDSFEGSAAALYRYSARNQEPFLPPKKDPPITFDHYIGLSSNKVQRTRLGETKINLFSETLRRNTP